MDRRAALRSMGFGFAAAAVGSAWMEECVGAGLTPTLRVSQDIPGPAEGVVRILYNENPLGCSPRASAALKELSTSTQYYGFREARMFIDRLRRYNGLPGLPNADSLSFQDSEPTGDYSLMLGVGSSELLKALAQATMGAGGTVIEPDPSYRAVGSAAMIVNPDCNVKRIPVDAMGNLDLKAMLSAVDDSTRLIVVTNPNNPTGGCVDVKALTSFVDSVPESVTILIDEAYIEYAENMDEISAIPLATSRPNVLVARTFSKLYGLAGLRLGYGIASNQLLEKITPYVLGMLGINSAVIAAASAALQDEADSLSFQDSEPTGDYSLMLGVGSSELLKALAQATMGAGGTVIEPDPSYRAVGSAAMIVNPDCNVKRIPVDAMGNLDLKAMLSAVDDSTRLIVVTNPNNPTGGCVDVKALTSFVDSVPESVTILIDEAYIEYAENMDEISAIPLATSRPNVLVARTFSKLYGLAGLRLGYGIASNQLLEKITPYVLGMLGINSAVIAAASAALQDEEHAAKARQLAKNFRSVMQSELPKYGLKVYPGNAPFVWAQAAGDATVLVKKLATDGVLISSGERWERPDCVRISAATESQTAQLLSSLKRHA